MSSRALGRGHRGGGMRGGYVPRGGGGLWTAHRGGRGGRSDFYQPNHGGRSPRPFQQRPDPEKLLASLGPDAQLALTTAIINSVLKTSEEKESRVFRDDRDLSYRLQRENRREGRGGYFREEMRVRGQYAEPRRYEPRWYNEEGRGHHYEREKSSAGPPRYRYGNRTPGPSKRRPSPHGHPGPTYKRQRMERFETDEGEIARARDEFMDDEIPEEHERSRDRERHGSISDEEHGRRDIKSSSGGNKETEGGPSGVQVTIRADGERAVNSEGHVRRVAGRLFVELRCPHCPNQKSITFKEYKMHLVSELHKSQLNRLARKHSVVLRKIRIQQRQEQKEIEVKWREENEEFKTAVSRFCGTCKLAFKCQSSNTNEGVSYHNRSKLHRMQRHYLHPRCGLCRITFPSRMVYEHHIASINHLRVRTATIDNQGGSHQTDDDNQEDDGDDLDLANFMTLDSVGEDDDEVGSEHEEITGGLDAAEAAEKAATGEEEKGDKTKARRKRVRDEDDNDDIPLEMDWKKEQPEDEEEEGHKPLGTEYVRRIEAYFCSICFKVIRADSSLGSRAVQRHCRSSDHLSHYWDHHPASHQEEDGPSGEEGEGEGEGDGEGEVKDEGEGEVEGDGELEEDPDQDKLWEEVDKGLTALQGEILTEIEGEDATEEPNKGEKVNGVKEEEEEEEEEEEDEEEEDCAKTSKEDGDAEKDKSTTKLPDETVNKTQDSTLDKEALDEIGDDFTDE